GDGGRGGRGGTTGGGGTTGDGGRGGRGGTTGDGGRGGRGGTTGDGGRGGAGGTGSAQCSNPLPSPQVGGTHTHTVMIPASALTAGSPQMFTTSNVNAHTHT